MIKFSPCSRGRGEWNEQRGFRDMQTFNRSASKANRRKLRNEATPLENILWFYLRKSQLGVKFRRQFGIGPYIVDFYCPKLHLVVEVDGDSHTQSGTQEYDRTRDQYMNRHEIFVIRVQNREVQNNVEGVLKVIADKVEDLQKSHVENPSGLAELDHLP